MSENACGLTPMTCGAMTGREVGELLATLRHIEDRLDTFDSRASDRHERLDKEIEEIKERLRAGDARFHTGDVEKAERKGAERMAMWIGRSVLLAAFTSATWLVAHLGEQLFAWLFPPKH